MLIEFRHEQSDSKGRDGLFNPFKSLAHYLFIYLGAYDAAMQWNSGDSGFVVMEVWDVDPARDGFSELKTG